MSLQYSRKIDTLMRQEMSRKDFLRYIGVALLGIMGVSKFLSGLDSAPGSLEKKAPSSKGYGVSAYGR